MGRSGIVALVPLIFFLLFYLGGSLLTGDFYAIPMTVAFLLSGGIGIALSRGRLRRRINKFSAGASDKNIMLMVWIYIMAGGFASVAKSMGAVEATVGLALNILPSSLICVALFLSAAFVSLSIGTSVGTVVAIVPIAAGIAQETGESAAMLTAIVLGGAYFGDNLSFISDTTIAATQTQGCKMRDKFSANIRIIWPAFVLTAGYCIFKGLGASGEVAVGEYEIVNVVPYILVIGLSIVGVDVLVVLGAGMVAAGVIGLVTGGMTMTGLMGNISEGIGQMGELIVIALLSGGMLEIARANGGIRLILGIFSKKLHGKRGAEAAIAGLVSLVGVCTANNTVAIITVGRIAKDIAEKYGIAARRAASILDTMSCFTQGLLPYGVQMLIASKLSGCAPLEILPQLYYPMLIGVCTMVSIVFRRE
ncbi:MAG: Na+/H+ antiporter NhaC family protein [Bacteroidales bacterium]|nr:Na+/H+ antiporter NhaC family protein [Bacteroidales bacterium]